MNKKHPALPPEPGWFLFFNAPTSKSTSCGKWRAGYTGKHHPHIHATRDTEAGCIEWLKQKHAEYTSIRASNGRVMDYLSRPWRA